MSEIKTNKLSSLTGTNNNITIDPDGTGDTIITSGVGINTVPKTFNTVDGAMQVGTRQTLTSFSNDVGIGYNHYYNSGWKYTNTDVARRFSSTSTVPFIWQYAASGSADAAITWSEAMRIIADGDVAIGKTSNAFGTQGFFFDVSPGQLSITCNQNTPLRLNRVNNDGTVVSIQGDGSEEGTISISGGTVSYNGGHLSRWSHLPDGEKDDTILKGTVLTNLDDMCHWVDSDGNVKVKEQLNQVQISSVEGDKNVAGVMVNWCDVDEAKYPNTIDLNMSMTGDMVIRIAEGTTVTKGDLLMSAGDGTAKPQDDDIVRSKTIAKVTSATVSKTYDDGTYLVPCVVMAC